MTGRSGSILPSERSTRGSSTATATAAATAAAAAAVAAVEGPHASQIDGSQRRSLAALGMAVDGLSADDHLLDGHTASATHLSVVSNELHDGTDRVSSGAGSASNAAGLGSPHSGDSGNPLPFVRQLWNILENEKSQGIIEWTENGETFTILDMTRFTEETLPTYFNHRNIFSFRRQLSIYGFKKTEYNSKSFEFRHPLFTRSHPELLLNIQRAKAGDVMRKEKLESAQHTISSLHDKVQSLTEENKHLKRAYDSVCNEQKAAKRARSRGAGSTRKWDKVVIGSDHGGYALKQALVAYLKLKTVEVNDVGTHSEDSVDYPDIASTVCKVLQNNEADFGIIVCGTGIGVSIAANKHKGIRCALCHDSFTARLSREHNDANLLALGGRVLGKDVAEDMVSVFMATDFAEGRHKRRVDKIMSVE